MWEQSVILLTRNDEVAYLKDSEIIARFGVDEIRWNECDWEIYMSKEPMTISQAQNWKPIRTGVPMLHYYAD